MDVRNLMEQIRTGDFIKWKQRHLSMSTQDPHGYFEAVCNAVHTIFQGDIAQVRLYVRQREAHRRWLCVEKQYEAMKLERVHWIEDTRSNEKHNTDANGAYEFDRSNDPFEWYNYIPSTTRLLAIERERRWLRVEKQYQAMKVHASKGVSWA